MKKLRIALLVLISSPSFAVWDLPNVHDGLMLGVQTQVAPNFVRTDTRFKYLGGDFDGKISATLEEIDRRESDERLRLSGVGEGYVGISAIQNLTRDLRLSGSVGVVANDQGVQAYPSEITLSHQKLGSIGLAAQTSLPVSQVATSQNFYLLDQEGSRIEAIYTGMPNLSVSAYHIFPVSEDTRNVSDVALHKGQGAAVSYMFDFAPKHILKLHAGTSVGERHVDLMSDTLSRKKRAYAAGLSYRHQNFLLAFDGGRASEDMSGVNISNVKTQAIGASFGYDISPRTQLYVRAGRLVSDKKGDNLSIDAIVAGQKGINETHLFDKVLQSRASFGITHKIHATTTASAQISHSQTTNRLSGQDFSKRNSTVYSAGLSFYF